MGKGWRKDALFLVCANIPLFSLPSLRYMIGSFPCQDFFGIWEHWRYNQISDPHPYNNSNFHCLGSYKFLSLSLYSSNNIGCFLNLCCCPSSSLIKCALWLQMNVTKFMIASVFFFIVYFIYPESYKNFLGTKKFPVEKVENSWSKQPSSLLISNCLLIN